MKTRLKKATAWLLTLCMAVTLLPAGVLAAESTRATPPGVPGGVTVSAVIETYPEGTESPGNATVTTADLFPIDDGQLRLPVKYEGLAAETYYYVDIYQGDTLLFDDYSFRTDENGLGIYTYYLNSSQFTPDDLQTFTLHIRGSRKWNSEMGEYLYETTYAPVELSFWALSEMPNVTPESLNPEPVYISLQDYTPYVNLYLPIDAYESLSNAGENLRTQLVGQDGLVYAVSNQNLPYVNTNSVDAAWYDEFFGEDVSIYFDAAYFGSGSMEATRDIKAGLYDLYIYDGDTLLYTLKKMVEATDIPLVRLYGNNNGPYPNDVGADVAYIDVDIENGDPNDFTVHIYAGNTLLGSSSEFHVENCYDLNGNYVYEVPLTAALEEGKEYRIDVTSSNPFIKEYWHDAMTVYENSRICESFFGSPYYANPVLLTTGYDANELYKAEFCNNSNDLMSTAFVSPDANGIFDIEFRDEAGNLIEIESWEQYKVTLYTRDSYGVWENYGDQDWIYNEGLENRVEEAPISLMGESTYEVEVFPNTRPSDNIQGDQGNVWFSVPADSACAQYLSQPAQFTLRITNLIGESYDIPYSTGNIRTYNNNRKYYDLYFTIPDNVPHAHYNLDLYYGGALLVNKETGETLTGTDGYTSLYDEVPHAYTSHSSSDYGLSYISGLHGASLGSRPLRMDLFTLTNRTTTPDYSFANLVLENGEYYAFTPEMLAKVNPGNQYRSVLYLDNRPIRSTQYMYLAPEDYLWMDPENPITYSVSAGTATNGTLKVVSATLPASGDPAALPAYTSAYVVAEPDEGYRLKPGSLKVNGQPLLGRGFPVTENCVVTAEFDEIPAILYNVDVYNYINNGELTTDTTAAAAGETVTVTLEPNNGYIVDEREGYAPYYTLANNSSDRYPLTKNADGTWSFEMPEASVTLRASFRWPYTWSTSTTVNGGYNGWVYLDNTYPYEMEETTVRLYPNDGYAVTALTAWYTDASGVRHSIDLLETPGEEYNTFILTLPMQPDSSTTTMHIEATFEEREMHQITNGSSFSNGQVICNTWSAYAGETLILTPEPHEGYRLKPGSLRVVSNATGEALALTDRGNDTFSFVMPNENVTLYFEFEEIPMVVPGGTVNSAETLQAALGGSYYAVLDGSTVKLQRTVTLEKPIVVTGGDMELDLAGGLTAPAAGSLLSVTGGSLRIYQSNHMKYPQFTSHAGNASAIISVSGGNLELDTDSLTIAANDGTGIQVTGGKLILGNPDKPYINYPQVETKAATASALDISGGAVDMYNGHYINHNGTAIRISGSGSLSTVGSLANGFANRMNANVSGKVGLQIAAGASGAVTINGLTLSTTETALQVDSSAVKLQLQDLYAYSDATSFKSTVNTGLKDYIASGCAATNNDSELLSDEQLAASTLKVPFTVARSYSITIGDVDYGTITLSSDTAPAGSIVKLNVKPNLGYKLSDLGYTNLDLAENFYIPIADGEYSFVMPASDVSVWAEFESMQPTDFLEHSKLPLMLTEWTGELNYTEEQRAQLETLNYRTRYIRYLLVDDDDNIVLDQAQYQDVNWMDLMNPGNLQAGTYDLYLYAGNENYSFPLAYQRVSLVNDTPYHASVSYNDRGTNLTCFTKEFDADVSLYALPCQLPDDLTLRLVDTETGDIVASSSEYDAVLEVMQDKYATSAAAETTEGMSYHLRFHLDLGQKRLKESSGRYELQLYTTRMKLVNYSNMDLDVSSEPALVSGSYDPATLTWTGLAEGLSAGSYPVAEYDTFAGHTLRVAEDGTATLRFNADPFAIANGDYISIAINLSGTHTYIYLESGNSSGNWYGPSEATGLYQLNYSDDYEYIGLVAPWSPDMGVFTSQFTQTGLSGSGRYELTESYGIVISSGEVTDISSFPFRVANPQHSVPYSLTVYNANGEQMTSIEFQFRPQPMLAIAEQDGWDKSTDTLALAPLNLTQAMLDSLQIGYITPDGRQTLPFTLQADGTIAVDVSGMPLGAYLMWAKCLDDGGYLGDVMMCSHPFYHFAETTEVDVTVAPLKTVKNESGVITADVVYVGGEPSADVMMDVYLLTDDTMNFVTTKNLGRSAYTINNRTLSLSGKYVFIFHYANSLDILGVRTADFVSAYPVTFLDWNGSVLSTQEVTPGESAVAPSAPTREGYTFVGWSCDFSEVRSNLTVTALYVKDSVTVKFHVGAGTGAPADMTVANGSYLDYPAEKPTREGYYFTGWYLDPACTQEAYFGKVPVTSDTILYAGWAVQRYDIWLDPDYIMYWSTASLAGLPAPGELVNVSVEDSFSNITAILVKNEKGAVLQTLTPVKENSTYWNTYFVMPAENVTLEVVAETYTGSMTFTSEAEMSWLQIDSYDGKYSYYGNYISYLELDNLPFGTYYVTGYGQDYDYSTYTSTYYNYSETFTLREDSPSAALTLEKGERYRATIYLDMPEDYWNTTLYLYDENGYYVGYAYPGGIDNYCIFESLLPGTYTMYAYDSNGELILSPTTFTMGAADFETHVSVTKPLNVSLHMYDQDALGAQMAGLSLEKQTASGSWQYVNYLSTGAVGSPCFESAISEPGTYRVVLEYLSASNGAGIAYESTPLTFQITEADILSGGYFSAGSLLYTAPTDVHTAFYGEGNLVTVSKNDVYPGDYVDLVIRYNTSTAVAPAFTVKLPAGVTCLDESLTVKADGSVTISAAEAAKTGTLRLPVKVTATSGALSIPVDVTLNGVTAGFGTAALSVAGVTLHADPLATRGEPFTVYGEAAPGSVVTIMDHKTMQILKTIPVTGRFYSAQLNLTGNDHTLQAIVNSNGNQITSEKIEVSVQDSPISVMDVYYNFDPGFFYYSKAAHNAQLDTFSFWQWVDLDLNGWDLPIGVTFANDSSITSVEFSFCGKTISAQQKYTNIGNVWCGTFPEGTWGGSGLKTITATVYDYYGSAQTFEIALVNLLIDPSGIVTDTAGNPLAGVTVICQVWQDGKWVDLDAASIGQVNPQVTDEDGRYGWNVPEGTYRVLAFKEGFQDYDSSLDPNFGRLDIPPARNDINFSMVATGSYVIYPTASENVDVTASKSSAAMGETVTLNVSVADGLVVDQVSVSTLSGKTVAVESAGNGTYTFVMPAEDVTYTVTTASETTTTLEITSADASGAVKVSVAKLEQNALLMTAFYDSYGRLIGTKSTPVTSGSVTAQCTAELNGTPASVRVFLLDPSTRSPLSASDSASVG